MAQLMLINPKRRAKRKAKPASKRRTYRKVAVKSNPAPAVRRRRRSISVASKRVSRRIRRNPIGLGGIVPMITDAAIGAGGAIAVNMLYDKLPLPATLKVGVTGVAAKAALALGIGIVGKKFMGNTAGKLAAGAMTVIAYDLIRSYLPTPTPVVNGMGYISPAQSAGYVPNMGEYVNGSDFNFATNNSNMGEYVY